jgi:hypothetical protein
MITHNALLDELASVTPELGDDVFLVAIIVRIDTQPDSGEIELPYEALANLYCQDVRQRKRRAYLIPYRMGTACLLRSEGRPVAIVKHDFEGSLSCQLTRHNLKNKYTRA